MTVVDKRVNRIRRGRRTRAKIKERRVPRLCVYRTPRHIYAQVISADGSGTVVSASTLDKEIAKGLASTGNIDAASVIGKAIAERAKGAGITSVAFDRSGFKYHGRVKALAESARENGLVF